MVRASVRRPGEEREQEQNLATEPREPVSCTERMPWVLLPVKYLTKAFQALFKYCDV
jgi:hypothetical protein